MVIVRETIIDGVAWTEIWPMFEYFDQFDEDVMTYRKIMDKMIVWCQKTFKQGEWHWTGITQFSYGFVFKNAEDATYFKLMMSGQKWIPAV